MITKLKRRFIILATTALAVLLAVIVAGMNLINYSSVVADADQTLAMLSSNRGRLPSFIENSLRSMEEIFDDLDLDDLDDLYDDFYDDIESRSGYGDQFRGLGGSGPRLSRDEAEETRFFSVLVNSDNEAVAVYTDRIYSVDEDEAAEYAEKVAAGGRTSGFVDDFRYAVSSEGSCTRITFLDCGRTLGSFYEFLRASIIMSLIGLAVMFAVMCYFAGRIVRPVAESYSKQKRFITDAGHEIKTPLTIIKANIDVMKMDIDDAVDEAHAAAGAEPDDEQADDAAAVNTGDVIGSLAGSLAESLDDISGQVDRLTTLTNDLVYLSRMEEAEGTLTMTEVPISDIVRDTAEPFEAVARERNKELVIETVPMLSMKGSTKELEKLVSILVENALKYSPEGDRIGVSLRKEGRNVILEVRNKTVTPVTDEDLAHVFERFYRTDKSRNSAAGGHGIGLSMASAIVAAHGGRIRARSGDGTEFIVTAAMPAAV